MRKAVIWWIAACFLLFSFPVAGALAAEAEQAELSLYVDGKRLTDAAPPVVVGREVYIPVETLAAVTASGIVAGDGRSGASYSNQTLEWSVAAGENIAVVSGRKVELPGAAFVENGRLYVAIRGLDQAMGMKSVWDRLSGSLFLYLKGSSASGASPVIASPNGGSNTDASKEKPAGQNRFVRVASNQVIIAAGMAAEPEVMLLPGQPARLVLDFPASAFGYNGVEDTRQFSGEVPGDGAIARVRHALFDPSTFRVVIELNGLSRYTVFQDSERRMTHVSLDAFAQTARIVIDAGHGGKDPGAKGASGREEKHFTLELAQRVYALMAEDPSLTPYLTRSDDTFIELEDRAAFANDLGADLFISLHGNTYSNPNVPISGVETYYYDSASEAFAHVMHEHVLKASEFPDRGVRQAAYKVLRLTDMPAVLLELGYLSTRADERVMLTPEYQDRMARAIVQAVKEYLNLK